MTFRKFSYRFVFIGDGTALLFIQNESGAINMQKNSIYCNFGQFGLKGELFRKKKMKEHIIYQ